MCIRDRHRLNRGGNRQANWALYEIAIKRMAYDERTRRYVARRLSLCRSVFPLDAGIGEAPHIIEMCIRDRPWSA